MLEIAKKERMVTSRVCESYVVFVARNRGVCVFVKVTSRFVGLDCRCFGLVRESASIRGPGET